MKNVGSGGSNFSSHSRSKCALFDSFPERRHTLGEHRLRILVRAAQLERAEVLVPVAIGRHWFGLDPLLQALKITKRDVALLNPL